MGFYHKYVPVHKRRELARKKVAAMAKKGKVLTPVEAPNSRGPIANQFWGQAWCDNLEYYSDFSNRLPRGRTYVRNGSVLHIDIMPGQIEAMVMGSELYHQTIKIDPLAPERWTLLKQRCQGHIGSLLELLQGKISAEVMAIVTDPSHGLFPQPNEIHMSCSCPDWASLCKHLAAVLYGVGIRLDEQPELLFTLRQVAIEELIQTEGDILSDVVDRSPRRRTLSDAQITEIFGMELDQEEPASPPSPSPLKSRAPTKTPTSPSLSTSTRVRSRARTPSSFKATPATIRALRERLQLTQVEFAQKLGVSPASVKQWEKAQGPLKLHSRSLNALHDLYRRHPEK